MWIWGIPIAILLISIVPLLILVSRLAAEAAAMAEAARGLRRLQPAMVEIRNESRVALAQLQQLRTRSIPR